MKAVHTTALVLIPPKELWSPIQEIRKEHDRNFRRWMPHITLIYPFIPKNCFYQFKNELTDICKSIPSFDITLNKLENFKQRGGKNLLWVGPNEKEKLITLKIRLCNKAEEHIKINNRSFEPHLTIARTKGEQNFIDVQSKIENAWKNLDWRVDKVSLIWRNEPPDDVFRVECELELGSH